MTSFPEGSVENPGVSEDFPDITGSVPQMIQATMERFRNLFIREKVIKIPDRMEALRIMNYPYQAIEEAVVMKQHIVPKKRRISLQRKK